MYTKHRVTVHPTLKMLNICELFKSIQGESTYTGLVCTFIRMSGCNLRCTYCDTQYAQENGTDLSVDEIIAGVDGFGSSLVEITGGEPLLQGEVPDLCRQLLDRQYTVLVETNGTQDISRLPDGCIRIMDIKCPGSGCEDSFRTENLTHLNHDDECKMVISGRDDFVWARDFIQQHALHKKCAVILSPNVAQLTPRELAEWIIETNLPVRLGLQIHKFIWERDTRGV